jgi:cytochrome P450
MTAIASARPPGPRGLPIIGQYVAFRKDPPRFLLRMAREYGDVVLFRIGPQKIYLLNHPDLIKDVLVTRQRSFIKSRVLQRAKMLLGEGLLTSEAPHHTRQRRLVQPAFHRERLNGYAATMIEYGVRTRDRWEDGQTFDVAEEMMRLTLAIVAKTLFSADVEAEAKSIGEALGSLLHLFDLVMMPFSKVVERLPLPSVRRFERDRKTLDGVIYRIIDERRKSGKDTGDLLSMLLLAQDEEGSGGMSDEQVRDEALTLFLAGHETTANALTWTWYLLSQHAEVEQRFQNELDEVLGGRTPTPDDFGRLKYTYALLAESIRLYPPAWAIGRMALERYQADGFAIDPRDIVLMSPYVVHRDARWYPDPERFDPDRWIGEQKAARPKFAYVAFGGGARVCIGENFAWMEGVLLLAVLGQRWRLRHVEGHPVDHRALITLRPKYGMQVKVQALQQ